MKRTIFSLAIAAGALNIMLSACGGDGSSDYAAQLRGASGGEQAQTQLLALSPTETPDLPPPATATPQIIYVEVPREITHTVPFTVEVERVSVVTQTIQVAVPAPITNTIYLLIPDVEPCVEGNVQCMRRWRR